MLAQLFEASDVRKRRRSPTEGNFSGTKGKTKESEGRYWRWLPHPVSHPVSHSDRGDCDRSRAPTWGSGTHARLRRPRPRGLTRAGRQCRTEGIWRKGRVCRHGTSAVRMGRRAASPRYCDGFKITKCAWPCTDFADHPSQLWRVHQDPLPQPDWVLARRRVIGKRIRGARLDAQMSMQRLGELAGVDRRTVSSIEYGRTDASLSTLLRIAHAVRVPLRDLIG